MKRAVWKFEIKPYMEFISMPRGAQVLAVDSQAERMYVWALVDPSAVWEVRKFMGVATGEAIPEHTEFKAFIGTVKFDTEPILMFHVWELT